jgi:hypothetical protein
MLELDLEQVIQIVVDGLRNGSYSMYTHESTLLFRSNITNEAWVVSQEVHDQLFLRGILQHGGTLH